MQEPPVNADRISLMEVQQLAWGAYPIGRPPEPGLGLSSNADFVETSRRYREYDSWRHAVQRQETRAWQEMKGKIPQLDPCARRYGGGGLPVDVNAAVKPLPPSCLKNVASLVPEFFFTTGGPYISYPRDREVMMEEEERKEIVIFGNVSFDRSAVLNLLLSRERSRVPAPPVIEAIRDARKIKRRLTAKEAEPDYREIYGCDPSDSEAEPPSRVADEEMIRALFLGRHMPREEFRLLGRQLWKGRRRGRGGRPSIPKA